MQDRPFRTYRTGLADEQLILLDVLFDVGASFELLREEGFQEQWNLVYSHGLDDRSLRSHLRWLSEHGALEIGSHSGRPLYRMTPAGGELWSQERCPVWERYCLDRYKTTSKGRTLMSVMAVSPHVRDSFLALWPLYPARRRAATITDPGLIRWHPFPRLYVGVATYHEPHEWTPDEYAVWVEQYRQHQAVLERERSWWRCVPELQRFVPTA
jgi:hypothetical protein